MTRGSGCPVARCAVGLLLASALLPCLAAPVAAEVETAPRPATRAEPRAVPHSLRSGGTDRTYRLYVPALLDRTRPVPVVVMLHGALGSSEQVERYMSFNAVADREGFAVVYPQGIGSAWNDSRPPELRFRGAKNAKADDVLFLRDLVRHLVGSGFAAPDRLFLAGVSNGGYMAARMACEAADLFAGYAFLISSVPKSYRGGCNPGKRIPVVVLSGTEDRLVPWEGYVPKGAPRDGPLGTMAATEHTDFWAEINGCSGVRETRLNDIDPDDGSVIVRRDRTGCAKGGAVTFYAVEGGGHQTPSLRQGIMDHVVAAFLGPRNRDAETAELVWDFFARIGR